MKHYCGITKPWIKPKPQPTEASKNKSTQETSELRGSKLSAFLTPRDIMNMEKESKRCSRTDAWRKLSNAGCFANVLIYSQWAPRLLVGCGLAGTKSSLWFNALSRASASRPAGSLSPVVVPLIPAASSGPLVYFLSTIPSPPLERIIRAHTCCRQKPGLHLRGEKAPLGDCGDAKSFS